MSVHMNRIAPVYPAGDGVSPRLLRNLIFQALACTDLSHSPPVARIRRPLLSTISISRKLSSISRAARRHLVRRGVFLPFSFLSRRGAPSGAAYRAPQNPPQANCSTGSCNPCPFPDRFPDGGHRRNPPRPRRARSHESSLARRCGIRQDACRTGRHASDRRSGLAGRLMAPTQILAEQHYLNFKRLLEPLGFLSHCAPPGARRIRRLCRFSRTQSRGTGERTRPRVPFPASRRKPLFGGTPNSTRGTRMLPGSLLARTRFSMNPAASITSGSSSSTNSTSSVCCSGRDLIARGDCS